MRIRQRTKWPTSVAPTPGNRDPQRTIAYGSLSSSRDRDSDVGVRWESPANAQPRSKSWGRWYKYDLASGVHGEARQRIKKRAGNNGLPSTAFAGIQPFEEIAKGGVFHPTLPLDLYSPKVAKGAKSGPWPA
jgi:hypothetical protein